MMNDANAPPFAALTPDTVLDAVDSLGLHTDGRMLALNSYENRVYQVGVDQDRPVVVKFYRPSRWTDEAILEEHDFLFELDEQEIPAVAPLKPQGNSLHHFAGFRFAVFPSRGGRAPELDHRGVLEWMGRFIGRIHAAGAAHPYKIRPVLDIAALGEEPLAYLLKHDFLPAELKQTYQSVVLQALEGVRRCYDRAGGLEPIRLHGDCHTGNVLWTDKGPHFVDFDDSRMGPAIQDLWMLLSGERAEMANQLSQILAGYEDMREFNMRELYLIEALRTLRLIHYSAWLARRWDDPAFPVAFPWFNTQQYWQDRILEMREQIALLDESPLWPV